MNMLDTLLAVAEAKGCACGLRPCLIHYAEQQRQMGAGYLKKTTSGEQAEFYVAEQVRDDRGGSSHRDGGRQPGDAGVRRDDRSNGNRPGKPVRTTPHGGKR